MAAFYEAIGAVYSAVIPCGQNARVCRANFGLRHEPLSVHCLPSGADIPARIINDAPQRSHPHKENRMTNLLFANAGIQWQALGNFEHLLYSILNIDRENKIIDVIFKFAARRQIVLHRHKALNHMLVIQGEHRLYEADGNLKEVRPVGTYTVSPPSDEPHREGGGDEEAIVFFSIRGSDGVLYEILDDGLNVTATLGMQDFMDLYRTRTQS
jgi:hypothetical protein